MSKVRAKLDLGAIALTIFTKCVHIHTYSNIQSHSLLSSFNEPGTNFVFNTPNILCNTSASVVLWLATTLARTNKRKWSLKNGKIKQNLMQFQEYFKFNRETK